MAHLAGGFSQLNLGLGFLKRYRAILVPPAGSTPYGDGLAKQSLIAIVDDDESFRDSMRRLIKSLGYRGAVFASAAEFLSSPSRAAIHCLVADIHMPEMSGVELYRHLVGTGQSIPTILVTAYPDEKVQARMLSEGVECYLRKPLEESALIECLRAAVAR
jgi:FixJ family two-component response regulator